MYYKLHKGKDFIIYNDGKDEVYVGQDQIVHFNEDENTTYILDNKHGDHKLPHSDASLRVRETYKGWNANLKRIKNKSISTITPDKRSTDILTAAIYTIIKLTPKGGASKGTMLDSGNECLIYMGGRLIVENVDGEASFICDMMNGNDEIHIVQGKCSITQSCISMTFKNTKHKFRLSDPNGLTNVVPYDKISDDKYELPTINTIHKTNVITIYKVEA